jgi:hypothetical protein
MKHIKIFEGFGSEDYYKQISRYEFDDEFKKVNSREQRDDDSDIFLKKYEINEIEKIFRENNIVILNRMSKRIYDVDQIYNGSRNTDCRKLVYIGFFVRLHQSLFASISKVNDGWYLCDITGAKSGILAMDSTKYFKCDQIYGLEKFIKDIKAKVL